jgi:glycosyltransferase involved in cell wall biosynthesis
MTPYLRRLAHTGQIDGELGTLSVASNLRHLTRTTTPMIKVLAVIEASMLTGPAKGLLELCRQARDVNAGTIGFPKLEISLATFHRLCASSEQREFSNQFVATAREAGIEVEVIAERCRFDTRVIGSLRKIIEQRTPNIVQTHNVKSHFLMRQSGLWRRRPWIAFHHGYTTTDLKMRAYNQLDRWSLRAAHRVITVSHAFACQLARRGLPLERIRVLHNSVGVGQDARVRDEEVRNLRASLRMTGDECVVLAVGRLSREKAHIDLVTALDHLRHTSEINVRLIIAGDGPERQRIECAAHSLGVNDRLTLVGQVSNIGVYYAMADALVLPSHSEGSPNVLLEAMAAGVPVVATAVGGVPEIVTHSENALLVSPHDPRAMAAAIGRILIDRQLAGKLAANAYASIVSRHSPERRLRSLVEIYRQLAGDSITAGT